MRDGLLPDAVSPVPIASLLPAIYRELDPDLVRLTEAFDAVLAPVWLVLDSLAMYVDAATAPLDFVRLLASWVGAPVDENWREDQLRHLVAGAVELHRWRGTRRGIVALVEAYTGATPDVDESGGTSWSRDPGGRIPGTEAAGVRVRVALPPDRTEDPARLTRLIASNVPAHLAVNVEIVRREAP